MKVWTGTGQIGATTYPRRSSPQQPRCVDMRTGIIFVAAAVFAGGGLAAEKLLAWPQFRGPGGSGVADGQKPPVAFGPSQNVKWKVPVPGGLSSPVVAGDK